MAARHWLLVSPLLPKGHVFLGREPVTLGRDPTCEVRVPSLDVSRRHAKIARPGVAYTIEDLDSENGTTVNGRSVTRSTPLEHDDFITIGTVQIRFVIADGEREKISGRFAPGVEETNQLTSRQVKDAALFAGKFTRETFHQVCQLIELNEHSGVLRVESGGCAGILRFKEGLIVDARFGPSTGEKAARSVLGLASGEYAFHAVTADGAAPAGSLKIRALALVLDVLRAEEEAKHASDIELLDQRPSSVETVPLPEREPPPRTQRLPRPKDL
jgi:pSer/pThr/pTyr-binding forkhead associated (FHA) protein